MIASTIVVNERGSGVLILSYEATKYRCEWFVIKGMIYGLLRTPTPFKATGCQKGAGGNSFLCDKDGKQLMVERAAGCMHEGQ